MQNYNIQLNNNTNEIKTLNELVRDTFTTQKSVVDVSFFYNNDQKHEEIQNKEYVRTKPKFHK